MEVLPGQVLQSLFLHCSQPGLALPPLIFPHSHLLLFLVPLWDFHWAVNISTRMSFSCALGHLQSTWDTLPMCEFLGLMILSIIES